MGNKQQDTGCSPTCSSGGPPPGLAQKELCTVSCSPTNHHFGAGQNSKQHVLLALPPPSKGQGTCCRTGDMRSNSMAPTATRSGHSAKTAGGKLSPGETVGSLTRRTARLHFTSEQFWMGKTDQNRPTTKKHNLS